MCVIKNVICQLYYIIAIISLLLYLPGYNKYNERKK